MENVKTENSLGYEKISKLLFDFAVPSVIAMLVSSLYNVVDQIFIGRSVGYYGNAATNVAFPITTICMAITLTLGIGTASRFSLYLGQKEEEKAAKAVGSGIFMMILFGIIYAVIVEIFAEPMLWAFAATPENIGYALDYVRITAIGMPFLILMNGMSNLARADGSPMYSMITMVIGAVINTILDPIFIFVFDMGVAGAAWATVIGQVVSCVNAMMYLRKLKRITLKKEQIRFSFTQLRRTAAMGMSNGLTQLALTVVQIVMNRSIGYYGELSEFGKDIPLAASGIVMKVNSIVLAVIIGIMQGMQPIVGYNYGARKYDRVKSVFRLVIICELIITLIGLFVFQVFPKQVLSVFGSGDKAEDVELYFKFAVKFMRIFLIFLPLSGIQMISSNFFSAIGKPIRGALLSLTRQVFLLIPMMLILPKFFKLDGLMYSAPVSDLTAFLIVTVYIVRELSNMSANAKHTE